MASFSGAPWALALGLFGFLPKQCWHGAPGGGPGGHGAHGGASGGDTHAGRGGGAGAATGGAGAATGGAGASTGGASGEGGATTGGASGEGGATTGGASGEGGVTSGGDAGAAGAPDPTDRVSEPLLGCNGSTTSGRWTPGTFEVLPPAPVDTPDNDPGPTWITDWSGDGRVAVGHWTTPVFEDAFGVMTISWTAGEGFDTVSRVRVELSGAQETPTALASCDGSVIAERLGDGSLYVDNFAIPTLPRDPTFFHDNLRLSEDGSTVTFLTGIRDQTRPSSEWYSSKGEVQGLLLESIESVSADGLTTFGTSYCFIEGCTQPTYFRWRPLAGESADVTLGVPAPVAAADGESVVHDFDAHRIEIWRAGVSDLLDCGADCSVVAWSSRAQVLLVRFGDGSSRLWTRAHGFRPLETLLTVPQAWTLFPDTLSLDGWTVAGTATNDGVTQPYFRATLNADAYR